VPLVSAGAFASALALSGPVVVLHCYNFKVESGEDAAPKFPRQQRVSFVGIGILQLSFFLFSPTEGRLIKNHEMAASS